MRNIISLLLFLAIYLQGFTNTNRPAFLNESPRWVDSLLSKMSLEQKIGQLIMVTTYPSQGEANEAQIAKWISDYHVGGILFLKSSPHELATSAKKYQSIAQVPLYIALDAENGLSFRLDSVIRYPHAMGLGAISNDSLIYRMGREIGQQCKTLGINLNFAPVADVNSNPNNPIINYRSFGENPQRVAQKSWQLAKGMQDEHVLVSAKHFPGHGDTSFDSHLTLPSINRDYLLLDTIDFLPFKTCIANGISGIMTAHINMKGIDRSGLPATLSESIMTGILKDSLGFEGLIFSDGMNMKGITAHFSEGEAAVKALKAGVDVIEFVINPKVVIAAIIKAIDAGEITNELIEEKCKKVLLSKKWLGLDKYKQPELKNLDANLNKGEYQLTAALLYEQSLTLIQNKNNTIPLQRLDTLKIASLAIGREAKSQFQIQLEKYMEIDHFIISLNATNDEINKIISELKNYNLIIAGVHGTNLTPANNYKMTNTHLKAIQGVLQYPNTIISHFGNPYALKQINNFEKASAAIVTYSETSLSQSYAAQLIFGAINCTSTLPVTINEHYIVGQGEIIKKNGRLKYTLPEEVGFNSQKLKSTIDSFAQFGIQEMVFPGCQVLVAKNGKVVFHESYGYQTYDNLRLLEKGHLYDWASVTKITGPLPLIMKMTEDSLLNLDRPFSNYWPEFLGSNKELITLREILTHQAGLKPWIPIYFDLLKKNNKYRRSIIREYPSLRFPTRISSKLYIQKDYKHQIFTSVKDSEILLKKKYIYSDLGFIIFPELITQLKANDYEQCLNDEFLKPLGASTVSYNPYRFYPKEEFVPTEIDNIFRKEAIQGFVHDETAAMLGGVSGHAGLFGTTNDLAKIMQFYLQKGSYGDFHYLKPATVEQFTKVQYPKNDNRRGLGFDKPYIDNAKKNLKDAFPAPAVSPQSYGHTGFTGIFVWCDPKNELLLIFMSNRTYPTRENKKITQLNFRTALQQAIYSKVETFKYPMY